MSGLIGRSGGGGAFARLSGRVHTRVHDDRSTLLITLVVSKEAHLLLLRGLMSVGLVHLKLETPVGRFEVLNGKRPTHLHSTSGVELGLELITT